MPGITRGKHIPQNKWITTHIQMKAFVIVTPDRKKKGAQFQFVSSAFHFHFSFFLNNTCVCIYSDTAYRCEILRSDIPRFPQDAFCKTKGIFKSVFHQHVNKLSVVVGKNKMVLFSNHSWL